MTAHRSNMRLADGIVHDVRTWATVWTAACGTLVFDTEQHIIPLGLNTVGFGHIVDDPVDCMACLVAQKTPFAVLCDYHGQQFLTEEQYSHQLNRPDSLWMCPRCGDFAYWDDDEYDSAIKSGELSPEDS